MAAGDKIWLNFATQPTAGEAPITPISYDDDANRLTTEGVPTTVASQDGDVLTKFDGDKLYSESESSIELTGTGWITDSDLVDGFGLEFQNSGTAGFLRGHLALPDMIVECTTVYQETLGDAHQRTGASTSTGTATWTGSLTPTTIDLATDSEPRVFVAKLGSGQSMGCTYRVKDGKLLVSRVWADAADTNNGFSRRNWRRLRSDTTVSTVDFNIGGFHHGWIVIGANSSGVYVLYEHKTNITYSIAGFRELYDASNTSNYSTSAIGTHQAFFDNRMFNNNQMTLVNNVRGADQARARFTLTRDGGDALPHHFEVVVTPSDPISYQYHTVSWRKI